MKISIIVPVYNEEKTIRKSLNALINQDYPKKDYEIVVVNDGSTDNTARIVKNIARRARVKIRLINLEKNFGRAYAREIGAKKAKYGMLLFIDSRCIAEKDLLKNLKKINYWPLVGNTYMEKNRSIFDYFFSIIRKKFYRDYFGRNFKDVMLNEENFDKIPKGTGIFFCSKDLFLSSQLKNKTKDISDDTKLLKNILKKKNILKTSKARALYLSRKSFLANAKHMFARGPKFVDYYFGKNNKISLLFYLFILIFSAFLLFLIFSVFYSLKLFLFSLTFLFILYVGTCIYLSKTPKDFSILFLLLLPFIFIFYFGCLFGIIKKIKRKNGS